MWFIVCLYINMQTVIKKEKYEIKPLFYKADQFKNISTLKNHYFMNNKNNEI